MKKLFLLLTMLLALPTGLLAAEDYLSAELLEEGKTITGPTLSADLTETFYKIELPEDGNVKIHITTGGTLVFGDLEFHHLNANGDALDGTRTSYDGGDQKNVDATMDVEDLAAGTYYIKVGRSRNVWIDTGEGNFTLSYTFEPNSLPNDEEPNNTLEEALLLENGQTAIGHLGYFKYWGAPDRDQEDWYKVELPTDGSISLRIKTLGKLNFDQLGVYFQNEDGSMGTREIIYGNGEQEFESTHVVDHLAAGTYYIKVSQYIYINPKPNSGGYKLSYTFNPNNTPNDREPNNTFEQAVELANGQTLTAHLGYYKNYSWADCDVEDWYKVNVSGTNAVLFNIAVDTTTTLKLGDATLYKADGTTWVEGISLESGSATFTPRLVENGTYYLKITRAYGNDVGCGSYSLTYGNSQRQEGSQIRVSFIGYTSVRLGVPCEYDIKVENIGGEATKSFVVAIPATEDIRLLGARLPGKNGYVEELTMDDITMEGDNTMWFVVPRLEAYQSYTFTIIAEGITESAAAPNFERGSQRAVGALTAMIMANALGAAYDVVEDQFTGWSLDVIREYIDLNERELAQYRAVVGHAVDVTLVQEAQKSGILAQAAKPTVKKICTELIERVPGGKLITAAGDAIDVLKSLSGALRRRIWFWIYKDLGYIKDGHPQMLDGRVGVNRMVRSWDPNEMVGPVGVGDENYIGETRTVEYRILFENKKEATAPAWRIRISDELDENVFDVNTVKFGSTSHSGNQYNWQMKREGNRLSWDIKGIELPPNVNAPEGEGYVTFSVNLKPGLGNGTKIANKATIIFDVNDPIETNTYINTLDLAEPTTKMEAAEAKDKQVTVRCSGSDAESGVGCYLFFASTADGEAEYIGQSVNPEFSFDIPAGKSAAEYDFYALAVDNVGNTQQTAPASVNTGIRTISSGTHTTRCDIYNLNGIKVGNSSGGQLPSLRPGVYILRTGNQTKKLIIK